MVIWPQLPLKIYRQSSHQEVLLVAAAAAAETHEISHAVSFPSALDTLTQKANPTHAPLVASNREFIKGQICATPISLIPFSHQNPFRTELCAVVWFLGFFSGDWIGNRRVKFAVA